MRRWEITAQAGWEGRGGEAVPLHQPLGRTLGFPGTQSENIQVVETALDCKSEVLGGSPALERTSLVSRGQSRSHSRASFCRLSNGR